MQIVLTIFSILMFITTIAVPVFIFVNIDEPKWYHNILTAIVIIVLYVATICVVDVAARYNEPKAIDVYRNKTTLKITYIDSIPQDTTVVFK